MKFNYLFYFCDGIGSVFDSQVLALLKAVSEKKIFNKVYLFLGIRNEIQRNELFTKILPPDINIVFFTSYPNYPFLNYLNRKSLQTALNSQNTNFNEVIFHTRGEMISWHLIKLLKSEYHKNIIPDIRGVSVEEIEEFYNVNKFNKSLKIINHKRAIKILNKFQKISVVSDSLKEYLITNYNIDPAKIMIIACLADSTFSFNENKREDVRKEFNLSSKDLLIVFSSGGTANWQNNEMIIMLAEKGLKVLNLSKMGISHKNVFNKFINYSQMPMYLNAADVALIWRNKSIVNKVASPVKFSEYICCGLPVIANNTVEMIADYITMHSCGALINSLEDIKMSTLLDLKLMDRKKISEEGILIFGIDNIVNLYLHTYSSINNL